jgi:hypothetical protein
MYVIKERKRKRAVPFFITSAGLLQIKYGNSFMTLTTESLKN